ncbi:c-type cytochrome [Chitinophaga agrisoli]|uniref:C-type cytochrome n=1 Tax=Chitinophaga agrisoli TaxID=2607653 RepID=A0A5B2VP70_9BACT|nr:c-type cytochrome [Chitinophaga agrisoli]KAA2240855.1 c-type cytochrome [Chitinophaga agrisoli]
MRKRFLAPFVLSALFFAACGGGQNSNSEQQANNSTSGTEGAAVDTSMVSPGANAPVAKGKTLIDDQDCKTCHKEDVKLVGPAYKDVAAKYTADEATIDKLADKVINGGSGNWGDVAMLPHPSLAKEDAKEMVTYILSLK